MSSLGNEILRASGEDDGKANPHAFGVDAYRARISAPWQIVFQIVFFVWVTFA
jgi:hypothetical protein